MGNVWIISRSSCSLLLLLALLWTLTNGRETFRTGNDDDDDDDDGHVKSSSLSTGTQVRQLSDRDRKNRKESGDPSTNKENESGQLLLQQLPISESHHHTDHGNMAREQQMQLDAIAFGLRTLKELIEIKEPQWYQLGLYLEKNEPASHVAKFGAPSTKALELSRLGFAALEASRKIAESHSENFSRQSSNPFRFQSRLLPDDECPLGGEPRCSPASRRYRTADGTCNNLKKPWRGSALLPMQRFLPPLYEDGIQAIRRSIFGTPLPSAREISARIHTDRNVEVPSINLMLMQWGQLVDHDITSTVKSRSFNGSIPRCCRRNGLEFLPEELTHPTCLPIKVPENDRFLSQFGINCMEFLRSAPSTRIDCDLGHREQINQVTSFLDGSAIYGSDVDTSDSLRTFRRGRLQYGRPQGREPLQPPDPPNGEICRFGALSSECFQGGDGRFSEQPGLVALHTIWLRYHNKIATILSQVNVHWSDEKIYQETRRIIVALIQHITYREFLPIILGQEVLDLFELNLEPKGYYQKYDERVNPTVANSFSTAAFRFGHSLVQNSYIRSDIKHRPIFNNVSLHEEPENPENIWSFGSIDRLLLGFSNQPSQRRDEFISSELTNHLFQSQGFPFGMDLASINIQRGRDHGLPPYTHWREPCGLSPIKNWKQLSKSIREDSVDRLRQIYEDVEDVDLFTGGLAEKPVRGGIVGPTFSCIIAQQFLNLRKGDRFWYENGHSEASFTPAQLQQIRKISLAQILCQTLTEIETIQPLALLTPDDLKNRRIPCGTSHINNFDLLAWVEIHPNEIVDREGKNWRLSKKRRTKLRTTTTKKPKRTQTNKNNRYQTLNIKINNITTETTNLEKQYDGIPQRPNFQNYDRRTQRPYYQDEDFTYLIGRVSTTTPQPKPIQVNIKIQYYPQTSTTTTKRPKKRPSSQKKKKKPPVSTMVGDYPIFVVPTENPYDSTIFSDDFVYRPIIRPQIQNNGYHGGSQGTQFEDVPFSTSKRPYIYRPNSNHYVYSDIYRRPTTTLPPITKFPSYLYDTTATYSRPSDSYYGQSRPTDSYYGQSRPEFVDRLDYEDNDDLSPGKRPNFNQRPTYATSHIEKLQSGINDKLDVHLTRLDQTKGPTKFIKISSVQGQEFLNDDTTIKIHLSQQNREGDDLDLLDQPVAKSVPIRLVDFDLVPSEDRWVYFNVTDDDDQTVVKIEIPDVNLNVSCSNEIPKPMTTNFKND